MSFLLKQRSPSVMAVIALLFLGLYFCGWDSFFTWDKGSQEVRGHTNISSIRFLAGWSDGPSAFPATHSVRTAAPSVCPSSWPRGGDALPGQFQEVRSARCLQGPGRCTEERTLVPKGCQRDRRRWGQREASLAGGFPPRTMRLGAVPRGRDRQSSNGRRTPLENWPFSKTEAGEG